jgi:hypothetical protein
MTPALRDYAKGDVGEMLALGKAYVAQLSPGTRKEVQKHTDQGLAIARGKNYNPNGYGN